MGLCETGVASRMETVRQVLPLDNYQLQIKFSTGEIKVFDARPYLEKGIFTRMKYPDQFRQAYVPFDTVCWPGDLDIAPETLYDRSKLRSGCRA